jgi:hypothetical protein
MNLPADVARCPGVQAEGQWREGCEDCLRRTAAPIDHPRVAHMAPPAVIAFECEFRIAPEEAEHA